MKTIFFASIAIALMAAACGGGGENKTANSMPGRAVFERQSCAICHGSGGEGTEKAPRLRDLQDHWTKDQLVSYMKNPAQYVAQDVRLKAQESQYPTMMPNYGHVDEAELATLAEYLLAL